MEKLIYYDKWLKKYIPHKTVEINDIYEKLGKLEELQITERLVELPCKVGDMVWEVDKPLGIITKWHVTEFVIHEDVVFAENPYLGEYCDIKEFGKTIFLTREEAEAELECDGIDEIWFAEAFKQLKNMSSNHEGPSRIDGINLWINVPEDDYVTHENICKHCCADPNECGEYPECCYNGWIKKIES